MSFYEEDEIPFIERQRASQQPTPIANLDYTNPIFIVAVVFVVGMIIWNAVMTYYIAKFPIVGPIGPQGIQGTAGSPGANGYNGTNGLPGVQGPVGPQGLAGSVAVNGVFKNASIDFYVYVNKGGNDSTATGTWFQPFLTISAALNAINNSFVSPMTGVKYGLVVGSGVYTEPALLWIPNVYIKGINSDVSTVTTPSLTLGSLFSTGINRIGFQDITITGSTTFDVQVLKASGSLSVMFMDSVFTSSVTINGQRSTDLVNSMDSKFSSGITVNTGSVTFNGDTASQITLTDIGCNSTGVGQYGMQAQIFDVNLQSSDIVLNRTLDLLFAATIKNTPSFNTFTAQSVSTILNGNMTITTDITSAIASTNKNFLSGYITNTVNSLVGTNTNKVGQVTLDAEGNAQVLDAFVTSTSIVVLTAAPGPAHNAEMQVSWIGSGVGFNITTYPGGNAGVVVSYLIVKPG